MKSRIILLVAAMLIMSVVFISGCVKTQVENPEIRTPIDNVLHGDEIPEISEEASESDIEMPDFEDEEKVDLGNLI